MTRALLFASARLLVPVLLLEAASACNPVYAPPVRAVHYGAPGRLHEGELEIAGTLAGITTPTAGSVHLAYGVQDWASAEVGGTFVSEDGTRNMSAMAWAGPRFTLPRAPHGASLLLDMELGIGAGVGGELCPADAKTCEPDRRQWHDRTAFGGYEGVGLGVGYKWFSIYARGRVEESVATNIPVTYWPSAMLGLGFDATRSVSLDLGGGYVGYRNGESVWDGWFYQAALAVRFGR
jgi:hypothetical protein